MKITEAVRSQYQNQHRIYERKVRPLFNKALNSQYDSFINWIALFGTNNINYDKLINEDKMVQAMILAYQLIGPKAAKKEYIFQKSLETKGPIEFLTTIWKAFFTDYAVNYAYRIQNDLSETTKEDVRMALVYANKNDITGDKLTTLLKKALGERTRTRANAIARTETNTALNLAKEQGFKQYAEEQDQIDDSVKIWIGRADKRERPDHLALNDTVIPFSDKWNVGGELAVNPGDENLSARERINCRCSQVFMTKAAYERLRERGLI
jgi:hypothetical protein